MLVLTRKVREQIRIGPNILITITEIKGNRVIVGISAPRELEVLRGELIEDVPVVSGVIQTTPARVPTASLLNFPSGECPGSAATNGMKPEAVNRAA